MTELLEDRRVLAGVVDVDTTTVNILNLVGDGSNNDIVVHGTANTGQFVVEGQNTLLTLDGGLQTFTSLTVNGITQDIIVKLKQGGDTFVLGDESGINPTVVGRNVEITNKDDDTNRIFNTDIGQDLTITRNDTASSELQIRDSIIRGLVDIDNKTGDTNTSIEDSEIEGTLTIDNGDGDDTTVIEETTIGAALFVRPDDAGIPSVPVVSIDNGNGSSLVSITRQNDPDSTAFLPPNVLGRPTIFGGIDISNGDPVPPGLIVTPPTGGGTLPSQLKIAVDIVVLNQVEVLGHLDIDNFDGHTETIIVDSEIGTDTKVVDNPAVATSGYGEAVTIDNGNGFDVTRVQDSELPWGLRLDNDAAAAFDQKNPWGSQTDIRNSEIGGRDSLFLGAGTALLFFGDDGDDVFNISDTTSAGTTIDGLMNLELYDGDDSVTINGVPETVYIESLIISGAAGDDSTFLQYVEIESMVMIELDSGGAFGVDTIEIRTGVDFPNALLGTVLVDGGFGADFYFLSDPTIPLTDFEIPIL